MDALERLRTISGTLSSDPTDHDYLIGALSAQEPDIARMATEVAAELVAAQPGSFAARLLAVLTDRGAASEARCHAAIAFGPSLEISDMEGFSDVDSRPPLERGLFDHIVATLRDIYNDSQAPESVRRSALEAAVRAIEPPWLVAAVRGAFSSEDSEWVETALFCSRYLETDFTREILSSLDHDAEPVVYAAVFAAVDVRLPSDALRRVAGLADDPTVNIVVRCSALEALAAQPSKEAEEAMQVFIHSDDEIIADKAAYLMSWRDGGVEQP